MKSRYSRSFERDYDFYLANASLFCFAPAYDPEIKISPNGNDAKQCFWLFDSTGKLDPCSESETLRQILICKKSVNFHLKLWASGFKDMGMTINEYLAEFINPPGWVKLAFESQLRKNGNRKK